MIKKCLEKIYNAILWTKKWHFFHLMIIIPGILTLWAMIDSFTLYITETPGSSDLETIFGDLIAGPLVLGFSEYLMFFVATGIQLIIILIKAIARKKLCVQSSFLLDNKIYNFIYFFFVAVLALTVLQFLLMLTLPCLRDYMV